jgi:hypothetical protein
MQSIQNVSLQILSKELVKEINDKIGFFKAEYRQCRYPNLWNTNF